MYKLRISVGNRKKRPSVNIVSYNVHADSCNHAPSEESLSGNQEP